MVGSSRFIRQARSVRDVEHVVMTLPLQVVTTLQPHNQLCVMRLTPLWHEMVKHSLISSTYGPYRGWGKVSGTEQALSVSERRP